MLVEFRVRNFLSFSQEVVLSTVASALSELKETNVFTQKGGGTFNLLKSLAIYGANASGKSNFLEAFRFMQFMVLNSSKETQVGENIPVHPFVLSTETQDKPSEFEVTFLFNGARYRYGFSADLKHINREWLYRATSSREALLFERDNQKIEVGTLFRKEAKDCIKKTRTNALFLSVVANFAGEIAGNITNWFQRTKYISVENKSGYSPVIFKMLDEKVGFKEQIIQYLKLADEGIDTIDVETKTFEDLPRELQEKFEKIPEMKRQDIRFSRVLTQHQMYNPEHQPIGFHTFDLDDNESLGTQKYFFLLGPVLDVLNSGQVLFVDEIESSLHSLLVTFLVRLFHSPKINPKNAQIIFTTHNTRLLDRHLFRRDQIWFTEKNPYGASDLYSLAEIVPRKDRNYEKDYLNGRYGAVPNMRDFEIFYCNDDPKNQGAIHGE